MDWSDVLRAAASFFLVVTGISLSYALIRAAHTLDRTSVAIDRTVDETLPLLGKAGETLDQVSGQLAHTERITGTTADAVEAAERSARAVVEGISRPVNAVVGAVAAVESAVLRVVRRVKQPKP
jgi:methyl-accepting chemotaxis protein